MAFVPYTLPKATTLFRHSPTGELSLRLEAGEKVRHERVETDTEIIDTVKVVRDGFTWTRTQRRAKESTNGNGHVPSPPVVVPAPTVSQQIDKVIAQTGNAVGRAIDVIAQRQTRHVDDNEKNVREAQRRVDLLTGRVYQLNYYIPYALRKMKGKRKVRNPSYILRKHAFRFDGSNWAIHEKGLNHPEVQRWMRSWDDMKPLEEEDTVLGGFIRHFPEHWEIEYTKGQLESIKEKAQNQLAKALRDTHRSLIERIDSAAKSLQEAQDALDDSATAQDRDKIENTYYGSLRATIKDACERFQMCLNGAEIFDDTGSLDHLFQATRDAIRTRAMAVNVLLEEEGRKGVKIPSTIG